MALHQELAPVDEQDHDEPAYHPNSITLDYTIVLILNSLNTTVQVFIEFRGHEPSPEAMLRLSGGNMGLSKYHTEEDINENDKDGGEGQAAMYQDHLTPAERWFLRQREKIEFKMLAICKSHRDRVQEFNQYLANLSEHYDIPKVGPG